MIDGYYFDCSFIGEQFGMSAINSGDRRNYEFCLKISPRIRRV